MKVTFIGGGNMASALIGGLVKQHALASSDILVIEVDAKTRQKLEQQFVVRTQENIDASLTNVDVIVLAVKPQHLRTVIGLLQPHLQQQLLISIAAGIRARDITRWLDGYSRIVRAMPNTPALIGMGITGLTALPTVGAAEKAQATTILQAVGQTLWVEDEDQLDALTALSGSGPAYVFYFIEAMQAAAEKMGFSPAQGQQLVLTTFSGATQLAIQSNEPISVLRERVTSPGGTTAAALASMTASDVQGKIVDALEAAKTRAIQLGDQFGQT